MKRVSKKDIIISERTEGMVNASASYYQESELFFYIMNAKGRGYDSINERLDDLALQLSPFTATWGLVFWEESVGLPRQPTGNPDARRPEVLARLQNYENFGAPMIHRIAEGFGEEIRVYIDPGECLVTITFQRGVPTFLTEFQKAVDNIIHAHLGTEYKFEYNIFGGLVAVTTYKRYGYSVPEAGLSAICGTLPYISTEGRLYSASLEISGEADTVLGDYDKTGTIASGPLPFVATEGRVYRTTVTESVDGTYTIETYKQASEKAEAGTLPHTKTEGRLYRATLSENGSVTETSNTYAQSSDNVETGTLPVNKTEGRIYRSVVSESGATAETESRYVEAGEIETGDKCL